MKDSSAQHLSQQGSFIVSFRCTDYVTVSVVAGHVVYEKRTGQRPLITGQDSVSILIGRVC